MGFFSNPISAVVKMALTPVAVAVDVVKVCTGDEPDTVKKTVESAVQDMEDWMEGN
jgi:hypothetical protein